MSIDETPRDEVEKREAQEDAVAAPVATPEEAPVEKPQAAEEAVAPVEEPQAAEEPEAPAAKTQVAEEKPVVREEPTRPSPKPERTRKTPAPAAANQGPAAAPAAKPSLSMGAWIGIAVAALVLGVVVGKFVLGGFGGGSGALAGKSTVTSAELDTTMATYTYNGATNNITVREVIEQNSSIEAAADAEGNYAIPSAELALAVARNAIIQKEAENQGLTVTDEELATYAEETLGSSDYASIATSYGMNEETVKKLLSNSCMMSKLRDQVIKEDTTATMPEAPTPPATDEQAGSETGEDGQSASEADTANVATPEYAAYIIKLAGDEWDAEKGTWKSADGPFASALASYGVTKDSATYEAAQAAYYVAYQQYSEAQASVSTQWTDYVNGLLANASIQVSTLVA